MVSSQTVAALYVDPRGPYPRMSASIARDAAAFPHMPRAYGMPDAIDCWDATRDARLYAGPHPVVAHPPCKHWGRLRHLAHVKCANPFTGTCNWAGKAHELGGDCDTDRSRCPECASEQIDWNDRDCAPRAVEQVRAYGGVLEHPAGSLLWEACGLPLPSTHSDARCRVCGHFELGYARAEALYAHCPSCNRAPHWLKVPAPGDSFGGYTIELDQVEWGHVARKRTWLYLVGVPRDALEAPPFPGREPTHWISGGRGRQGKKAKTTPVPPGIKVCSAQQRRRTPPMFAEYLVRLARAAQK